MNHAAILSITPVSLSAKFSIEKTIMVITAKCPIEPAHTALGVIAPVITRSPKKSSEHQLVLTVSQRYRDGTVTANTWMPSVVMPFSGLIKNAISSPSTSAMLQCRYIFLLFM